MRQSIPDVTCFSETSIRYAKRFFELYNQLLINLPQLGEDLPSEDTAHTQQIAQKLETDLFSIPWGHHKYIIDKCSDDPNKALFYVQQTLQNGWSRSMLLNFMGTDLYERQGRALTNFNHTLPPAESDLAQEITKDPYNFAFAGITQSVIMSGN